MIPLFKPQIDQRDEKAVVEILRSGWLGNGPKTAEFEKKFLQFIGARNAVATNSASAALHLTLLSCDLKPGDEVITPSLTFVATNHPILMVGATPVFCDVTRDTLCADPHDIEQKITKKTRIIIVVHYGGHAVDLDPLLELCRQKNIFLIEDCAHATGAHYKGKHVGSFGDFSCFSFAAIKNLTTGDGGMLVGKNKERIEFARTLAWSGISQGTWERMEQKKSKWQYNVREVGWKYQMNDLAASIGIAQLAKLKKNNLRRQKITERYNRAFQNMSWIEAPVVRSYAKSSYHNYVIKVPAKVRDRLSKYLKEHGIGTSVHYVPTHRYDMYKKFTARVPVTEKVWKEILLLPIFPDLAPRDQEYVIDTIKKFQP